MKLGICSFSFHRTMASGAMDFAEYVRTCQTLGCSQLDPWNAHLSDATTGERTLHAGRNPSQSHHLAVPRTEHLAGLKAIAERAGLPFGTIAIDGAHIYEPTPEARRVNRERAYGWLDAAAYLGARQARIDAGGDRDLPDDQFQLISQGYNDLLEYATARGIELLIENHWGPAIVPENIQKMCSAAPGLGLLFDTHNWIPENKAAARRACAPLARATHIKTLEFDESGNDIATDITQAVAALLDSGYAGTWGIESVPRDGDEVRGARQTIEMIKRLAH